jgi:hypothetical protein
MVKIPVFISIFAFAVALPLALLRIGAPMLTWIPQGYDPGFYLFAMNLYKNSLPSLPAYEPELVRQMQEPLFGIIADVFSVLWYDPNFLVGSGFALFSIITGLGFYSALKPRFGKEAGFLAMGLWWVSIVGYETYWWNYIRNLLGIFFFLTTFSLLERKSVIAFFPAFALFAIHRPSAAIFLPTFLIYAIFEWKKLKDTQTLQLIVSILFAGIAATVPYMLTDRLDPLIKLLSPLVSYVSQTGKSGTFMTTREYVASSILLLIPALYFLRSRFLEGKVDFVSIMLSLTLLWTGFRFFFYNRMLVFLEVAVILAASIVISNFLRNPGYFIRYLSIGILLLQTVAYGYHFSQKAFLHSISAEEFAVIRSLDKILPTDTLILSAHRASAPWLYGYSNFSVISPELIDHPNMGPEEWKRFHTSKDAGTKCRILQDFRKSEIRPIAVWIWRDLEKPDFSKTECADKILLTNFERSYVTLLFR